jgi:non-homologous end joining protein Ku
MNAIWRGYLTRNRVTIPIKMFTAITKQPLQFHLYHKTCGSPMFQEESPGGQFRAPAFIRLIE